MAEDAATIKSDIVDYIDKNGGNYSGWYVGIAQDPRNRLFKDHNVDEIKGGWIYRNAGSKSTAERIEKYFVEELRTKGKPGGGSDDTTSVYAYKIEAYTNQ
jgi:hypothetical protein